MTPTRLGQLLLPYEYKNMEFTSYKELLAFISMNVYAEHLSIRLPNTKEEMEISGEEMEIIGNVFLQPYIEVIKKYDPDIS